MRAVFLFVFLTLNLVSFGQQNDTAIKLTNYNVGTIVEKIYESFDCEQRACFPGGDNALFRYLSRNVKYPLIEEEVHFEGSVFVKFVVTKNGEIGQILVMRAFEHRFEEEAIRVVKSFPKWNPAIKDGKPVNSWFIVPVKFRL